MGVLKIMNKYWIAGILILICIFAANIHINKTKAYTYMPPNNGNSAGYFTGATYPSSSPGDGDDVLKCGINVDTTVLITNQQRIDYFTNRIYRYLNNNFPEADCPHQAKGAAFIVCTMLGYSPFNCNVNTAKTRFDQWKSVVESYSRWNDPRYNSSTRIDWNSSYNEICGAKDPTTGYDPISLNTRYSLTKNDVFIFDDTRTHDSGGPCPTASNPLNFKAVDTIVFYNLDGTEYRIKKDCGNPIGQMASLKGRVIQVSGYMKYSNVSTPYNGGIQIGKGYENRDSLFTYNPKEIDPKFKPTLVYLKDNEVAGKVTTNLYGKYAFYVYEGDRYSVIPPVVNSSTNELLYYGVIPGPNSPDTDARHLDVSTEPDTYLSQVGNYYCTTQIFCRNSGLPSGVPHESDRDMNRVNGANGDDNLNFYYIKQLSPKIDPVSHSCSGKSVTFGSTDPNGGLYGVSYEVFNYDDSKINDAGASTGIGGSSGNIFSSNTTIRFKIDMSDPSKIDQKKQYRVKMSTRGFPIGGGVIPGSGWETRWYTYPRCSYGFTLTPNPNLTATVPTDVPSKIEDLRVAKIKPCVSSSDLVKTNTSLTNGGQIKYTVDFWYEKYGDSTTTTKIRAPAITLGGNSFSYPIIDKKISLIKADDMTGGCYNLFGDTTPTDSWNIPQSGINPQPGDQVCSSLTISPYKGEFYADTNLIKSVSSLSNTKTNCYDVVNMPYVKFVGSDVLAGGNFKNGVNCPTTPVSSRIATFKKNPEFKYNGEDGYENSYRGGAGAQFGAFANNVISRFNSAYQNTSTNATAAPSVGLTFANIEDPLSGTLFDFNNLADLANMGGGFGTIPCTTDYWGWKSGITNFDSIGSINSSSNGYISHTGNTNINGLNLANGVKKVVFVEGDVTISNNITYSNTSWSSESDIPNFILIVKGNIYIKPNVKILDGIYVAQPDDSTSKGTIYTCSASSTILASTLKPPSGECYLNSLTVNGTFIAQTIKFLRTANSLRDNVDNLEGTGTIKSAETFIFSPEVYMSQICIALPHLCSASNSADDSIVSLPPIL